MSITFPYVDNERGSASSLVVTGSTDVNMADTQIVFATISSVGAAWPDPLPGGYTQIHEAQVGTATSDRRHGIFKRVVQADDPVDVTFNLGVTTNFAFAMMTLRGVDQHFAINVAPTQNSADTGSTLTAPSCDPDITDGLFVCFFDTLNPSTTIPSLPAGMTSLVAQGGTGSVGHAVRLCYEQLANGNATGTRTSTSSNNRWVASSLVIKPSPIVVPPGRMLI